METTKTVLAPGERITVIDALRGVSSYRHLPDSFYATFWSYGDDDVSGCVPVGGNDERDFQLAYQLSGFREILHYLLLPVRFKFLYPDGSGGEERT